MAKSGAGVQPKNGVYRNKATDRAQSSRLFAPAAGIMLQRTGWRDSLLA